MKVSALIKLLQKENPDAQVILQKDAEGNGFSPLSSGEAAYYIPDSTWSGTVYSKGWTADDCCMEEEEHAKMVKSKKAQCVVLAPVN